MNKLFYFILLVSSVVMSQPIINQPPNMDACDIDGNGFESFDLTMQNDLILNGLDPMVHEIYYFETEADSHNMTNIIGDPFFYTNTNNPQTIYVSVIHMDFPNDVAYTFFELNVSSIQQPSNLVVNENPFDGFATFDLTEQDLIISNGMGSVSYYETSLDAQSDTNVITNATNYTNVTNPQTIYVRYEDYMTGCILYTNFDLVVATDYINFTDSNFKAKLISLGVDTNSDTEIQYSEAAAYGPVLNVSNANISNLQGIQYFTSVTSLYADNNQLVNVDFSNNLGLNFISCRSNLITSINLGNNTILTDLLCDNNQLATINISNCTALTDLWVFDNQLTSLNTTNNANLRVLSCGNNDLNSLNLSTNTLLEDLQCTQNNLTTLDLTNNANLTYVTCDSNQLNSLDVTGLDNLATLSCSANNLTVLECTTNTSLTSLYFPNNPLLEMVFLKNGSDESSNIAPVSWSENWTLANNPSLQFVCADDFQVINIQSLADASVNVNSYCSFTPGGDYNTITGKVYYDINSDGCDVSDPTVSFLNLGLSFNAVSTNGSVYSNNQGNYNVYAESVGTYTLTSNLENPTYFTVNPSPVDINFPVIDNSTYVQDFCVTANGVHPDLEVVIAPIVPARPGFDAVYQLVYKNKGNTTVSGTVDFSFDDAVLDFVSSSLAPDVQSTGMLSFNYTNIEPFENRAVYITLNVNSPTDSPSVNIDDILSFSAFVNPVVSDVLPADNTFQYDQKVVGSFDPNNVECLEGEVVSPTLIGDYLHYIVNFENTGTSQAENIVLKMEINPAEFDITKLQLLNSSHTVATRVKDNIVEFVFEAVYLDTGGHGNVLFKIGTNPGLTTSDFVNKKANIYFDYNYPVETNEVNTTFQVLSNNNFDNQVFSLFPNPSKGLMNINSKEDITLVQLFDIQGRLIQSFKVNSRNAALNFSSYNRGVYLLKVESKIKSETFKIILE